MTDKHTDVLFVFRERKGALGMDGFRVVRPVDMLLFDLWFQGLSYDPKRACLNRTDDTAFLIFEYPPQHLLETTNPPGGSHARAWLSKSSRLAYTLKKSVSRIPLTLDALFDHRTLVSFVPRAGPITNPDLLETCIEVPTGLCLAPVGTATWIRPVLPTIKKTKDSTIAELWQTVLARRDDHSLPRLFAFHCYSGEGEENTPLTKNHREQIVRLTSDAANSGNPNDEHLIRTDELRLTALGASLKALGHWDNPSGALVAWDHNCTLGRDHYVRVVERGMLWPYGHRASLVTVSERRFRQDGSAATLVKQKWIVVTERTVVFPSEKRDIPFARVDVAPDKTPPLQGEGDAFWPEVKATRLPFYFTLTAVDRGGRTSTFPQQLAFVLDDRNADNINRRVNSVNAAATDRRTAALSGQRINFVPALPDKPNDIEVRSISFLAPYDKMNQRLQCQMEVAEVIPVEYRHLQSGTGQTVSAIAVSYDETYVRADFDEHAQLFLVTKPEQKLTVTFDNPKVKTDRVGGILAPNLSLAGFTRKLGPVSGTKSTIDNLRQGRFDPASYFEDGRILGTLALGSILGTGLNMNKHAPVLRSVADPPGHVCTTWTWSTTALRKHSFFDPIKNADPTKNAKLTLSVQIKTAPDGKITHHAEGLLQNFKLAFGPIALVFNKLQFISRSGAKPFVDPDIKEVSFSGGLTFLNELRSTLQSLGERNSGLYAHIQPSGVSAGLRVEVPSISLGVIGIKNVALDANLSLSFTRVEPVLSFYLSRWNHPFLVSVGIFGGGGYLEIQQWLSSGASRVKMALEFGGNIELDLGLASGAVYVRAGVWIEKKQDNKYAVAGYFRCGGHLDVLGLVSLSLEFYLELRYENRELWGMATLSVTIEILFFSVSVDLSVERRLSTARKAESLLAAGLATDDERELDSAAAERRRDQELKRFKTYWAAFDRTELHHG